MNVHVTIKPEQTKLYNKAAEASDVMLPLINTVTETV